MHPQYPVSQTLVPGLALCVLGRGAKKRLTRIQKLRQLQAQGMGHLDSCQQLDCFMDDGRNFLEELPESALLLMFLAR